MPDEEMKLKLCPFCGGEARLQVTERGVAVVCIRLSECGCRTDYYKDFNVVTGWDDWKQRETAVEKAVEAWNRRTGNA